MVLSQGENVNEYATKEAISTFGHQLVTKYWQIDNKE